MAGYNTTNLSTSRRLRRALGRLRRSPVFVHTTGFLALQGRVARQRLCASFVRGVWLKTADYISAQRNGEFAHWFQPVGTAGQTRVPGPTFVPEVPADVVGGPLVVDHPAGFVATLVNPWVIGLDGAVIGRDRRLLWDLSYEWPGRPHRHTVYQLRRPDPVHFDGCLATLAVTGADWNYFHFLLNSVARLAYLKRAPAQDRPSRYLVTGRVTPFVAGTLALFGVPREQLIGTAEFPALRAERLVAPALIEGPFVISAEICEFVRQTVLAQIPRRSDRPLRIFIDRSDARTRRIANLDALRPLLAEYDIEVRRLAGLSVAEQAELFNRADLIIANHGAGLSNLVFCESGTRVLQILAPGMMESEYRTISHHRQLRHDYLLGDFATAADAHLPRKDRDLVLTPAVLRTVLEESVRGHMELKPTR